MADLQEIATLLDVEINLKNKSPSSTTGTKACGKKRRVWIEDTDSNTQIRRNNADNHKRGLKGVYKPRLSTPFINPVDQPLSDKGLIDPLSTPLLITLENLRGNPLKLLMFFYEITKNEVNKITKKITFTEIMKHLEISRDSVKTGLRFLLRNKLIYRVEFIVGKSGWSKYKIEENLNKRIKFAIQKGSIHPITQNGSNSSSSNYINTTTTKNQPLLDNDWSSIDISDLESIGFTHNHLLQIETQNILSATIVQNSIYAFAFDLQKNNKAKTIKGDPINFFIGILRSGKPYVPPSNYESPKDEAMRMYLERMREIERSRVAIEQEALELAFRDWFSKHSEIEKKKYLPPSMQHLKAEKIIEAQAKEYFKKEIWIKKELEIKNSGN